MPIREVPTPSDPVYRVARAPDPLRWPAWQFTGRGRFDDPQRTRNRVLYTGKRRACFFEVLADFRPDVQGKVTINLTHSWLAGRRQARFTLLDLDQRWRWLDLRAPETHQALRRDLAHVLVKNRLTDFDISTATSSTRDLTQPIGAWAFDRGYHGIRYASRFDVTLSCWAIFDRPDIQFASATVHPVFANDTDLVEVARIFDLTTP